MKIALLGDIAIFGKFCLNRKSDYTNYFSSVRNYLADFEIVVANLEAPFVVDEKPITGKSATLQAHPDNIELLKYLGITHVTLANNHTGDFGIHAYERTKKILDKHGIGWFGTEDKQIEIQHNNEKVALLGFCSYNTNPSPIKTECEIGLNYLDVELVLQKMNANKKRGFLNILAVHSGLEHVHMPSSEDILLARGLSRKFEYIYYGHHPHVLQGYEIKNKSPIFYSLGNFIFDDVYTKLNNKIPLIKLSEENKTGGIGVISISNGEIVDSKLVPIYLAEEKMLVNSEVNNFNMIDINKELDDACSSSYNARRNLLLNKYFQGRIALRNFEWYAKRININSFIIIAKGKINSYLYKRVFLDKLNKLEN